MTSKTILAFFILGLISCGKQAPKDPGPEKITTEFFTSYRVKGPKAALRAFLPMNKYITPQDVDSVAVQLERLTQGFGDFQGYEKISEASYGTAVTYLVYIVKYTRQPVRFNFTYYEPGTGWRIQNFSYESNYLDELQETAKPFRLRENHER